MLNFGVSSKFEKGALIRNSTNGSPQYLLVVSHEKLWVNELHNLVEERVTGDEAHIDGQCIVVLLNRNDSSVFDH